MVHYSPGTGQLYRNGTWLTARSPSKPAAARASAKLARRLNLAFHRGEIFSGVLMQLPYLSGRKSYDDAAELMAAFGDNAGYEAAARADRSRDLGNHIHFCHWRQIERLIVLLTHDMALGTVH